MKKADSPKNESAFFRVANAPAKKSEQSSLKISNVVQRMPLICGRGGGERAYETSIPASQIDDNKK